jgi:hypothetical protein
MGHEKKFDVFLSHNSVDKPWVKKLKDALQQRRLRVWLDRDEIRPGDRFVGALEKGLDESRTVALIVSPEAMQSGWVQEEYSHALSLAQAKTNPLQLIPIILKNAELPPFLANRNWVDFRDDSAFDENLERLIWGITGKKPADNSPRPRKNKAVLDRRLVTELIILSSQRGGGLTVDPRSCALLRMAFALFENLLVENVYGSMLVALVSRDSALPRQSLMIIEPNDSGIESSVGEVIEDASLAWSKDPEFQVESSRYDQLKGAAMGNSVHNADYLQHTLELAVTFDAAIVPHPDRWALYHLWFEDCLWADGNEFPGKAVVALPDEPTDEALQIPKARAERIAAVAEMLTSTPQPLSIVRFGPLPYPFPLGLLRNYDRQDLAKLSPFLYEFCIVA